MGRHTLPTLPPSAVVWCIVLATKPPTIGELTAACARRWGRDYGDVTASRVRSSCRFAAERGWIVQTGEGRHATVAMAAGSRFRLEHDPTQLRGYERALQLDSTDTMTAWRRAQAAAR